MKKGFIWLFVICTLSYAQSYNFSLKLQGEYAKFNLSDLKNIQSNYTEEVKNTIGIDLKDLESFPPYYCYEIQFMYIGFEQLDIGFLYSYCSSGARSFYSDYSGTYLVDYMASANSIGILIEKGMLNTNPDIVIGCKLKYFITTLLLDEQLTITGETLQNEIETITNGIGLEPNISLEYQYSRFNLRIYSSYLTYSSGYLHDPDDENAYLQDSMGSKVRVDWGGLRTGLLIGIYF